MRSFLSLVPVGCLVVWGCAGAPGPVPPGASMRLPWPTARLGVPAARLELRVTPDAAATGYRLAALEGAGKAIVVSIEALDLASPVSQTATGSLITSTLVVENVPVGKARLITLQALDGAGTAIAGATLRAVSDLEAGQQTVDVTPRSTAVGGVFARLLESSAGRAALAKISWVALGTLLEQTKNLPPRPAHFSLLDTRAIADAIVAAGGALPAASAAFHVQPGTVRLTVKGAPENVPFGAWVGDPASPRGTGLSHVTSQTGDLYELGPVVPGTWLLTVDIPRLGSKTVPVTVAAGQIAPVSMDFSTWQAGPALPSPLGAMGAAALGSKIYVFGGVEPGGRSTDSVFVLDAAAANPVWQRKANLPLAREGPGVGVVKFDAGGLPVTRIVVAGGQTTDGSGTDRKLQVDLYDPDQDQWSSGAALPAISFKAGVSKPIFWGGLAAASTGDRLIAVQAVADYGINFSAAAEYDAKTNKWLTDRLPVPLNPRMLGAAAFLGTKLYFAGGLKPGNPTFNAAGTTQFPLGGRAEFEYVDYGAAQLAWKAGPTLPTGRGELAMASSKTKIYAAGGVGPGEKALPSVEVYDPAAGTWGHAGSLRAARSSFGLVAAGNKLWALGGSNSRLLAFFAGGSALATDSVEFMPLPEGSP